MLLTRWFLLHFSHPVPQDSQEMQTLVQSTGLTSDQVIEWLHKKQEILKKAIVAPVW